jgi:hypothetical protein
MPVITQPYNYGVDFYILNLAHAMHPHLLSLWNVNGTYNCFTRAYRNYRGDGYIPEFYDNTANAYVDGTDSQTSGGLFFEDTMAAISFFGVVDPIRKNEQKDDVVRVQLLFFVDLSKITAGGIVNSQNQRLDEVCMNDVRNFIEQFGQGFTIAETYRDIDKVLERYSGALKKRALLDNLQPKFCFRIDLDLRYDSRIYTPN